ncbi:TolC family protein [Lacisediminimonas sp.]|uniref:TolC family protein n=1 Tax=Lacisediminimonas sp. TaxID=3060582 RepID=UPI002715B8E5|nr:TolC family protein [Lacisediminimonas sp.]MDO8299986.1 TolC family protein [Lacisediminimonas sp.]
MNFAPKPLAAALSLVFLSGCASFSADGGISGVSDLTQARTGQKLVRQDGATATEASATTDALLAKPLTADGAVAVALLNNRALQGALAELGVAEADLVQAGRMRNPGFSFGRSHNGSDVEIERSIFFDLAGLLTIPMRSGIERRRFESAQLITAGNAVNLAADVRRAYFNAIAARQVAHYFEQVVEAAAAGAELGKRLARVGNWSKLDEAREQVFHAEALAQFARARQNDVAAREQLTRLMGLWGERVAFTLPERLPDLPKAPAQGDNAEAQAMTQRLDIQVAKKESEATAAALGLTRATAFVNVLDFGYKNKSETGKSRSNGYEVELVLPIFDWGTARKAKAEALYMQALHRTADTAIRARSQVRESYAAYRTTYDVARHYRDQVVPLRKRISDEVLLRYNGMLSSTFELLADARDQVNAVSAAIEAQRDFWIAEIDLQAAINGSGSTGTAMRTRTAAASASAAGGH